MKKETETQKYEDFAQGQELYLQDLLGCHKENKNYAFRVWAPNAQKVWLVGDFNQWGKSLPMTKNNFGIWSVETNLPQEGQFYKYLIKLNNGKEIMKIDPMAVQFESRPADAAVVTTLANKRWKDGSWIGRNKRANLFARPINIYEVHPSSWKKHEDGTAYNLKDFKDELIPYVKKHGFNYIEFMPLTAHPLDASWGYQTTGYFALEASYGTPEQLQDFVEKCHQENIGVIMDWVPGHFCINEDALAY